MIEQADAERLAELDRVFTAKSKGYANCGWMGYPLAVTDVRWLIDQLKAARAENAQLNHEVRHWQKMAGIAIGASKP